MIAALLLLGLVCLAGEGRADPAGATEVCVPDLRRFERDGTRIDRAYLTLPRAHREGSAVLRLAPRPFDSLLLSLNPMPWPEGSSVRATARVRLSDGAWSEWLPLGTYGPGPELPRSAGTQRAGRVEVHTDVLRVREGLADRCELRLELRAANRGSAPRIRRIALACWEQGRRPELPAEPSPAWGRELAVPERSQCVEDPRIAGRICSPTSLAMLLDFWERPRPTAQVAAAVHDRGADIYGNWSFNVAHAATFGFEATATRLDGFLALEAEIAAGRPVVISHRYARGELAGAPVSATAGHLIVVRGFTQTGDPIVNDPAADPRAGEPIRRVYRRAQLRRSWLENAEGVAYLLRPPAR